MDSYKIVSFKKRSREEIAFIPHKWEINGTLYWPKKNLQTLLADASSDPCTDWLQYTPCTIKKNGILSYEDAIYVGRGVREM